MLEGLSCCALSNCAGDFALLEAAGADSNSFDLTVDQDAGRLKVGKKAAICLSHYLFTDTALFLGFAAARVNAPSHRAFITNVTTFCHFWS